MNSQMANFRNTWAMYLKGLVLYCRFEEALKVLTALHHNSETPVRPLTCRSALRAVGGSTDSPKDTSNAAYVSTPVSLFD